MEEQRAEGGRAERANNRVGAESGCAVERAQERGETETARYWVGPKKGGGDANRVYATWTSAMRGSHTESAKQAVAPADQEGRANATSKECEEEGDVEEAECQAVARAEVEGTISMPNYAREDDGAGSLRPMKSRPMMRGGRFSGRSIRGAKIPYG